MNFAYIEQRSNTITNNSLIFVIVLDSQAIIFNEALINNADLTVIEPKIMTVNIR